MSRTNNRADPVSGIAPRPASSGQVSPRFPFAALASLALTGFLALAFLAGCAHNYVITLNTGVRVNTTSKPRLVEGKYYFTDANGREIALPAGRVREIAPASMAKDETYTPPASH